MGAFPIPAADIDDFKVSENQMLFVSPF